MVSGKDIFGKISEQNQKKYEKDTINRYGRRSFKKANKQIKKMSPDEWERYQSNLDNIIQKIANSMDEHAYNSKKVQKLIAKHFKLIGTLSPTTKESYTELANLYSEHEDFISFFNNYNEGLSEFLAKSMIYFLEND